MDYNKNYYKELNLDKNASDEDIKKSYRKLAMLYHPDKTNGDKNKESLFQRINEANEILSDNKKRSEYDMRSPYGKSYGNFNGDFFNLFNVHFNNNNNPFEEYIYFNNFKNYQEFKEHLDISLNVNVTLKDVYLNSKMNIKYNKFITCDECDGTGFNINDTDNDECVVCDGTGNINNSNCEYCRGTGKIHNTQCEKCKGEKVILSETEINIQQLSNIRSNLQNIYQYLGHQSKYYKDKKGTLILNIILNRIDDFKIINNTELHKTINIHFQDAIDGIDYKLTHIDDTIIEIKIPEKTKNDDIIIIENKGLLKQDKNRDNLYLKINVIIDYKRV